MKKISDIRNKVTIMRKLQLQVIQSQLSYMKNLSEIKSHLWDPKEEIMSNKVAIMRKFWNMPHCEI